MLEQCNPPPLVALLELIPGFPGFADSSYRAGTVSGAADQNFLFTLRSLWMTWVLILFFLNYFGGLNKDQKLPEQYPKYDIKLDVKYHVIIKQLLSFGEWPRKRHNEAFMI